MFPAPAYHDGSAADKPNPQLFSLQPTLVIWATLAASRYEAIEVGRLVAGRGAGGAKRVVHPTIPEFMFGT